MLPLDDLLNLLLLRFIGTPSSSNPFGNAGGHESNRIGVERIAQKRVYQNGAVTLSTGDAMTRSDVLIVGAGPTGLVLALWLTKLGAKVRIVDKTAAPGTTSRALAVHARTLELYRQLDLADAVIARGHKVPAVNLWVGGAKKATISFENVGADITPYPFLHIFPQDEHEKLLISGWPTWAFRWNAASNASASRTKAKGSWRG